MGTSSLLLIEDNAGDARLLREMFAEEGSLTVEMTQVGSMREAETVLASRMVDIILLDLGLPDTAGLGAVQRAHAAAPRIPLVVLTGFDDESMALQALQEGAQDYLVKGQIEARGLLRALRYAMERKTMEEALFEEKERAQVTLNSIGDAVICTDVFGDVTFLNLVAERMTGWSRQEAEGRPMADVFRMLDTTNRATITYRPLGTVLALAPAAHIPSSCILLRRDGMEFPIEDSVAPIHDREGNPTGAVVVFRDVSAARASSTKMTHLAQHDFLTGLPNRALLNDRINQAIGLSRRHVKQTAVLFLDLDGFKHINDSLGHSVGDRLLQSIAKRLLNCARASDTVSRQGGDEFVVLLSEMEHPEDAAIAADRILQALSEGHCVGTHELHVTTSIGVSVYPHDGGDAETLIKNADTAMYQAKESGRHKFQFFRPEMNARAVERQSMEQNLRRALERNEFALHYQPKIDFKTGTITGAEALLRWTHPTRGAVSPAQFIPVAEDCGLILTMGNWVLRQACKQAQAWVNAGLPLGTMAVNVSANEFRDEHFLEGLFASLDETGLDPRLLELELTESVLMKNSESAASILDALRARGVQVAIDDFGTGYSSLSYLGKFPVDALKIDQSFVSQISASAADASIVIAVINMAHSLNLRVVAEGVETVEQLGFLRAHGCDEAQGYYFSRPVAAEQFAKLLSTGIKTRPTPSSAANFVPTPTRSGRRRSHRLEVRQRGGAAAKRPPRRPAEGRVSKCDVAVTQDTLAEARRFKNDAVAMLVHDLRNPLSAVLANQEYVLGALHGDRECREALEDSQGAGRRMLRLLANFSGVTQLENGALSVHPSEINLPELIRALVEQRRGLVRVEGISISLLPGPDIVASLDVDLVRRTLENILDNARRHTPSGGSIVIELRLTELEVEIRIGNSGPPIPLRVRQSIFDKGRRTASDLPRDNIGLGLHFCRVATWAQGGQIWIEETAQLPTVFCIRLPRLIAAAVPPQGDLKS